MTKVSKSLVASAVTGMVFGALSMGCANKDAAGAKDPSMASPAAGAACGKGKNSCAGKGGCKSGDKGCAGKNSCAGKGGCDANCPKT